MENRKIKKPYIKVVRDSCLWDSGRWEWWEIILGWIPVKFSRHLTLQNLRNMNFLVISSILGRSQRKVNDLPTSPNNQFWCHFIRNRMEELVPLNWNFAPRTLKPKKELTNLFSNSVFCEIWVSKNPGFVPGSPPGGFIFPEMTPKNILFDNIGQPSKNCIC